ncbi:MAG: hypothetical protein ACHQ15_03900 [Candidatus Limnocylindrales bacterium]
MARKGGAIRRLALGAAAMGTGYFLSTSLVIVATDMPSSTERLGPAPVLSEVLGMLGPVGWLLLLVGSPVLSFAIGLRLRGIGLLGAAVGLVLGGFAGFALGDQLALALDPHAFPLYSAADGIVGLGLVAMMMLGLAGLAVVGLIGWLAGAARRPGANGTRPPAT